jgi:hypothetical protein
MSAITINILISYSSRVRRGLEGRIRDVSARETLGLLRHTDPDLVRRPYSRLSGEGGSPLPL